MRSTRSSTTLALAATVGWHALGTHAECAYRFSGYPNLTALPTWTLPAAEADSNQVSVIGAGVYLASDGSEEALSCSGDSWMYQTSGGSWMNTLTFPEEDSEVVTFDGVFNATGDGGITVSSIPSSIAPAMSNSLFGRTIQLNLTCDQPDVVSEDDACVLFQVEFTNYSPSVDVNMALFRFNDPVVPGLVLPLAQPDSPGDIQLNEGNPIVDLDGSDVDYGCNGDTAEYLGEDGEWYFWFTGSNSLMYNLTHVFYATEEDHVNIATIQENWSPNLEAALYNRMVRLLIHCTNQVGFEEGYLLFQVGDTAFAQSCDDVPGLCVEDDSPEDNNSVASHNFGGSFSAIAHSLLAMGVTLLLAKL